MINKQLTQLTTIMLFLFYLLLNKAREREVCVISGKNTTVTTGEALTTLINNSELSHVH